MKTRIFCFPARQVFLMILGSICFVSTIRFLKILNFNKKISMFRDVIVTCRHDIASFSIMFVVLQAGQSANQCHFTSKKWRIITIKVSVKIFESNGSYNCLKEMLVYVEVGEGLTWLEWPFQASWLWPTCSSATSWWGTGQCSRHSSRCSTCCWASSPSRTWSKWTRL